MHKPEQAILAICDVIEGVETQVVLKRYGMEPEQLQAYGRVFADGLKLAEAKGANNLPSRPLR